MADLDERERRTVSDIIDDAERRYRERRAAGTGDDEFDRLVGLIRAAAGTPGALPVRQPLEVTGTFRIHFNRHGAAPLVWSVATDHFELAVEALDITAPLRSIYSPKATPDDEDGRPSAWLEVSGTLTLVGSTARITRSG